MEFIFYLIQEYSRQIFSFHTFGLNLLDLVIIFIVLFYAYEGYSVGLMYALLDLLSFLGSFLLALFLYVSFGNNLSLFFRIPPGLGYAIAFFTLAFISEIVLNFILKKIFGFAQFLGKDNFLQKFFKKVDHPLGIFPGIVSALIILSFLLAVLIALPSSPTLKKFALDSRIGGMFITKTSLFERQFNEIFKGAVQETLNVLTVKPESSETVELNFKVSQPTVDMRSEKEMLKLINIERKKHGLGELVSDERLVELARDYSRNMLEEGYFSHYNRKNQSPFARMEIYGISYTYAGENLALAPSVELAHQGLMNSPGHRANILSPDFRKVGIGVMDGGIYGKMFSQEFTD